MQSLGCNINKLEYKCYICANLVLKALCCNINKLEYKLEAVNCILF